MSSKDLVMNGRRQLTGNRVAERVANEVDLRAGAGLVIEIEQEVADGAPLDRGDQTGDGLGIASRNRSDFGSVEIAGAAELTSLILAGEREHAGPRSEE